MEADVNLPALTRLTGMGVSRKELNSKATVPLAVLREFTDSSPEPSRHIEIEYDGLHG